MASRANDLSAAAASSQSRVIISEATFRTLINDIFGALGYNAEECLLLAQSLLDGSRAGYPSHGIMRVPVYVDDTRAGTLQPGAVPIVTHEMPAAVAIDGRRCLGQVASVFAIEQAASKARQAGIGCAAVRNANDFACLGSYLDKPVRNGLITVLMSNGGAPCVAPFGSHVPFLSTNAIAAGIPRRAGRPPIVIDFSPSVVSLGRVKMAANQPEAVPEGWLVDRAGAMVTDPSKLFSTPREAALLPAGSHKGFLMSLIVEVFAGALTGAGMSSGSELRRSVRGLFVLVVDPEGVGGNQNFLGEVEEFVAALEALPAAGGSRGVRMPGTRRGEAAGGDIPVDQPTWARITKITEELSLDGDYPVETVE